MSRNVIHLDEQHSRNTARSNLADPQRQIFSNFGNFVPRGVDASAGKRNLLAIQSMSYIRSRRPEGGLLMTGYSCVLGLT